MVLIPFCGQDRVNHTRHCIRMFFSRGAFPAHITGMCKFMSKSRPGCLWSISKVSVKPYMHFVWTICTPATSGDVSTTHRVYFPNNLPTPGMSTVGTSIN